jgi:uncharacterized protein (DUF433 family)
MAAMVEAFGQELVTRITGLSKRQLEYWDETDVIKPSIAEHTGFGRPRLYSFRDLIKLKVAAAMRDAGKLPSNMRETMQALEAKGIDDPFVTITFVLTTDGNRVAYIDPVTRELLDAHHGNQVDQTVESFGLPLRDLRTGLEETIQQILERRHGRIARVRTVQGQQPVVEGTRVPTSKIAAVTAAGWSRGRVLTAFPHLTADDVDAALKHEGKRRRRTA